MGKVSLKVLEKGLNFLSKKVTKPVGASMGRLCPKGGGGGRGYLFRLQVYERVGVLQDK